MTKTMTPLGPFDLADQSRHFGGWITTESDGRTIVLAFPVEGWQHSVAVAMRQNGDGTISGTIAGTDDPERAWRQTLAVLSLDADGTSFPEIGAADPVIGVLQREHAHLRPVLFHSPYEAACAFVIAHRLRITQGRAIRQRMAERHGAAITVAGTTVYAFPTPDRLLQIDAFPGIDDEKVQRLHGIARAALDGLLDRHHLRSLPVDEALAATRRLRGIGEFFASGIVLRGAGLVDAVPGDDYTLSGIRRLYQLAGLPTPEQLRAITDVWRPYRMWCSVLVHMAERRSRSR